MDYIATLNNLEKYYSNLLIVQYNGLQKAKTTIELMTWLIFSQMLLLQIRDSFDWRTATGKQLDIIGDWVGVSRAYNGALFWGDTYLAYPSQDNLVPDDNTDVLQHGYSDYDTFDSDTGNVLTYNSMQFVTQNLSDDDFRVLIGLKIIKNNINHTAKNIDDAIFKYFNGKQFYSSEALSIDEELYDDKELTKKYGEVWDIDGTAISIAKSINIMDSWSAAASLSANVTGPAIYINDKFIIPFNNGITTSTDGSTWTKVNIGIAVTSIAYGNSVYVATGVSNSQSYIATSANGTTWSTTQTSPSYSLTGIVFAEDKFIAIDQTNNYIYTSTDGSTWTQGSQVAYINNKLLYANGVLLSYGTNPSSVLVSLDYGVTWQYAQANSANLGAIQSMAYGNGLYLGINIGSSNVYVSTNGINWQRTYSFFNPPSINYDIKSVFYANNLFILIARNSSSVLKIFTSPDGVSWTPQTSPIITGTVEGVYGNHTYVVYNTTQFSSSQITYNGELDTYTYHNSVLDGDIYKISAGEVYTTWTPHTITYHYPEYMDTLINIAEYKRVLPAPTGVQTVITQI